MKMGRDERINAATIQLRQARDLFVRRLCEANTHTLDAVAVTIIVTMPEPGAAPGTCSTVGYTAWGQRLELQPVDHQDELCRQHIAAATRSMAQQVEQINAQIAARRVDAEAPPSEELVDAVEQQVEPHEEAREQDHE